MLINSIQNFSQSLLASFISYTDQNVENISGYSDITDHLLIKYCGCQNVRGGGDSTAGQFLSEKITKFKCPAKPNTLKYIC